MPTPQEETARTALRWCVRTTLPCSVNGEGHAFMEPWLPGSCRQDQAKEPAWVPRGTCVLQIGNPREPPPFPGQSFQSRIFCQCGSLMSPNPTGRHGNAVLIISLPYWEASFTRAAIPSPVPSLATAEARGDIKLFSGTSLLVFSSVSTPHPTALVCGKVGIRKGRLPVAAWILSYGR